MPQTHFYRPREGHRLAHDPFKSIIAPRPIGWISSLSPDGVPNLAPYSFFNCFGSMPPLIGFASETEKDSLRNIRDSGEFVYNLATRPLAEQMNISSAPFAPEVDEFARAGLTAAPCQAVKAPRVAESPASFECKVTQIIHLQLADGSPSRSWLVMGEVVGVHLDLQYVIDGVWDTAAAMPIQRAGGTADYFQIGPEALFKMVRPTQA
jgi:flavin reductase (DIM6/NTAB) family NADH-FMN oxidoreductase RutF